MREVKNGWRSLKGRNPAEGSPESIADLHSSVSVRWLAEGRSSLDDHCPMASLSERREGPKLIHLELGIIPLYLLGNTVDSTAECINMEKIGNLTGTEIWLAIADHK